MRKFSLIVLSVITGAYAFFGLLFMTGAIDGAGTDPAGRGLSAGLGLLLLIIAGAGAVSLFLGRKTLVGPILAAVVLVLPVAFFTTWAVSAGRSEARAREERDDLHSGKYHFAHDPALFALASAIVRNDQEAIRAAAKALPDLQASGRDGMTLLNFAIKESWQRPELVAAVKTLLDAGADPNFTNEHRESYAMANSVHGSVLLLRTMLDAGGNPNASDERGRPMIFGNWQLAYFEHEQRARFELLLERGADVNSTLPPDEHPYGGYTLALYRASGGRGYPDGYADALYLLERGADPKRVAADGTTLAQMLAEHRQFFATVEAKIPPEFDALWQWLQTHAAAPPAG